MEKQFLTEQHVSEITSIPLQTLRNWRHLRKQLSYLKVNRSIRYELADVLKFMEERKIHIEDDGE